MAAICLMRQSKDLSTCKHKLLTMSESVFTKEDCIGAVEECAKSLGKSPSIREYREYSKSTELPSAHTVRRVVGWNKAKEAANLEIHNPKKLIDEGPPDILDISEKEWKNMPSTKRNNKRKVAENAEKKLKEGCKFCGYSEHPAALSWHHRKSEEKLDSINRMLARGAGDKKLAEERKKCFVVCANCHRSKLNESGYSL